MHDLQDPTADALRKTGTFPAEVQVKPKRRTLIIAVSLLLAKVDSEAFTIAERQNTTRMPRNDQA